MATTTEIEPQERFTLSPRNPHYKRPALLNISFKVEGECLKVPQVDRRHVPSRQGEYEFLSDIEIQWRHGVDTELAIEIYSAGVLVMQIPATATARRMAEMVEAEAAKGRKTFRIEFINAEKRGPGMGSWPMDLLAEDALKFAWGLRCVAAYWENHAPTPPR